MTLRREELAELIDAYLDGRLEEPQRRQLESLAQQDAQLAAELHTAKEAEAALRRLFAPPEAVDLAPDAAAFHPPPPIPFPSAHSAATVPSVQPATRPASAERSPNKRPGSRWPVWVGAAAVVALADTAAVYMSVDRPPTPAPRTAKSALSPGELYATLMKKKFKPAFVCENDEQFAKFLGDRFGSGAVIAQAPTVEILGWDYADGMIGEATAVIMANVEEKHVVLVVDEKKYDHPLAPPSEGLHMFRDVCNGLVFYEITPLDEPRLLPLLKAAAPLVMRTD